MIPEFENNSNLLIGSKVYLTVKNQISPGVRLRSLQTIGKVLPGTVGTVDLVREPKAGWQWGFTVQWQGVRSKERYSAYFGEDDLVDFELAPESSSTKTPEGVEAVPQVSRKGARWCPEQLSLPFQD